MLNRLYVNLNLTLSLAGLGVAGAYAETFKIDPSVLSVDDLKPRIVVLTDIAPGDREPDDMESIVRLLSHADLFEIEALITTSGWNSGGGAYSEEWASYLHTVIDAYEKDLPNLMKRSCQQGFLPIEEESGQQKIGYWPSAEYLRDRHRMGSRYLGLEHIGKDNISSGSDIIIQLAEEKDSRPIWILVWGGGNTVAQALWQLRESGDEEKLNKVLDKIRLYTITDQDVDWMQRGQYDISSHKWMRKTFGDRLFFIWDESAWLSQNEIGASNWTEYESKIQTKGNMGSVYPKYKYGVEGDTPSFLYVLPNGLNNPEQPEQGGWGGYFRHEVSPDSTTSCFTNMRPEIKYISQKYEKYFYPAIFNNFAARMEWAASGVGNRNPELVINGIDGLSPIEINASPGDNVLLDVGGSNDPDGDGIEFKWWIMPEAGDSIPEGCLEYVSSGNAEIKIPEDLESGDIHVICECKDSGSIPLTSYRRIILHVR
ncbi:MAG: DUF1593 domain-containing protein [Muribaculaceae bacterium]|nr:DUF1593 domain-containing protein [Muribaculaceae bacterium]